MPKHLFWQDKLMDNTDNKKKIICIIPARAKSKRIKNKNIKIFCGKPLIYYAINTAKKSNLFSEIYVSTDSLKIKKISEKYGAKVPFLRSKSLSGDYTSTKDVLIDFVKKIDNKNVDIVFCLYPTSPLLSYRDLTLSLKSFLKKKVDCLLPVSKHRSSPLRSLFVNKKGFINFIFKKFQNFRSQDLRELYYDTGTFYIYKKKKLLKNKFKVFPPKTTSYILDNLRTIDINEPKDFKDVQLIYKFLIKKLIIK